MLVRTLLTLLSICVLFTTQIYSQDLIQLKCVDTISVFFDKGNAKIQNMDLLKQKLNANKLNKGTIRFKSYIDSNQNHASSHRLSTKRYHEISMLISNSELQTLDVDTINTLNQALYSNKSKHQVNQVDIYLFEYVPTIEYNKPKKSSISFTEGTSWMLPESKKEMNEIYTIMKNDSSIQLSILSNVCCNMDYSIIIGRAEKIKAFLKEKGIDESRISCAVFDKKLMEFYLNSGSIPSGKRQGIDLVFSK